MQSYPKKIGASTSINIEPETLPHLIKVTKMFEMPSGAKWFFNAVTGKLVRWNVSNPTKPIVLTGNSRAAPLAAWQHPTAKKEDITFLFPDALKKYRDQELITTEDIELVPVKRIPNDARRCALACDLSWRSFATMGQKLITYTTKNTSQHSRKEGFLVDNVHDVIEDSSGSIWFATKGGGTVRYDGKTFDSLTTKDGLVHNNISKIL